MIIRKDGDQLMQAATLVLRDNDEYSLTIDCVGLTSKGDPQAFTLVFSRNEIAFLTRAERSHR